MLKVLVERLPVRFVKRIMMDSAVNFVVGTGFDGARCYRVHPCLRVA
jgi:hypothetical protein